MRLAELVAASRDVGSTPARSAKIERLAALLASAAPDEVGIAVAWLSGELTQERIGLGPAAVRRAFPATPPPAPTLGLREVDHAFDLLASMSGPGSSGARLRGLNELLERASADERDFLVRLVVGELRQGALEGVMVEAVARAARVPVARVRRAWMLSASLPAVARAAFEGQGALDAFGLELFRPVQPMLAASADGVDEALAALGEAAIELKVDGARIQAHKRGDEVRLYTRNANDVTSAAPEVVEALRCLRARELVLDGEVVSLLPDGRPRPFQVTMRRFGRRLDVERLRAELPLSSFFFDALRVEGDDLLDRPAAERFAALAAAVPAEIVIPRVVPATVAEARAFAERALAQGHEGVVAKSLSAPYEAGRRGSQWLKVKPAHTLDLVVLAAEWGHGRRRGKLSNLHLGARDPASGRFVMLGKTFKGLTDAMLDWQTSRLLELAVDQDAWVVHVRPELVVEIALDGVQSSPHYPAGLALRFARVKRHRPDKPASEADTLDAVRALHPR